jgi:hypothetical protein
MTETSSRAYTPLEEEINSNIVRHGFREIRLAGIDDLQEVGGYITILQTFAEMGHSGGSAPHFIDTLVKLLNQENLTPLTNDPAEWKLIPEDQAGEPNFYQNTRHYQAFSRDGGKTYTMLGELSDDGRPFTFVAQEAGK